MPLRVYEAILSLPASIARIQAAQRAIERVGGSVKLAPATSSGMVLVTLVLPDPHRPHDFFPDLPFYPV
jgi:hypothetical protein